MALRPHNYDRAGVCVRCTSDEFSSGGSGLCEDPRYMTVAIDFDGTWTRDPDGMRAMVKLFQDRGHTCILLTGRSDEHTWGNEVRAAVGGLMPIVFAANQWKRDAAKVAGYKVDIFIDDHPEYVAAQDPRLTVGRTKIGGAPPKKPPKLAAERIRFGSSWLCGATIREIRGGYLLIGTMRPGEAAALIDPLNSGALVPIPLIGDAGETVVVTLFVSGFKMAQSAQQREVCDVELDLIGTDALSFGTSETP